MNESIVNKIEQLIKLEGIGPEAFSRIMFGLGGFFNQLVGPSGDRAALAKTPLIQRAMARFAELEQAELARLRSTLPGPRPPEANGPAEPPRAS